VHIVHNIPEEDLMDIVDEVFEDVNFDAMMDNDKDILSKNRDYKMIRVRIGVKTLKAK